MQMLGIQICFVLLLVVFGSPAAAQSLRFFARPAEAFEGDAVVFTYRHDTSAILLPQIAGWRWDFDGDGRLRVENPVIHPNCLNLP